jgi:uncharacterized membrane protein
MEQEPLSTTPPPAAAAVGEDRTTAIVAYITLVGFIVAIILHGQKKTALGAYHLRQALGLCIVAIALWFCGMVLAVVTFGFGVVLMPLIGILMLVAVIMGIIAAANGEMKPNFLFGKMYEKWFRNAFN